MYYKRSFFVLALLACSAFSRPGATESDLVTARSYYEKAVSSKSYADQLQAFASAKLSDATMRAYLGVSKALQAKHHWNPYSKYTLVNAGLGELNRAVSLDSKEVEIRFLRFSVEENLPGIVSFTSHIPDDKTWIINNLKASHGYYSTIRAYMLKSKNVSEAEKQKL